MGGDAAGQGVRPRDTGTGERVGSRGHGWGGLSTGTAVRASGRATRTGGMESLRGGRLGGWVVLGGRGCVCVYARGHMARGTVVGERRAATNRTNDPHAYLNLVAGIFKCGGGPPGGCGAAGPGVRASGTAGARGTGRGGPEGTLSRRRERTTPTGGEAAPVRAENSET